jgi:hypothetical protein
MPYPSDPPFRLPPVEILTIANHAHLERRMNSRRAIVKRCSSLRHPAEGERKKYMGKSLIIFVIVIALGLLASSVRYLAISELDGSQSVCQLCDLLKPH